MKLTFRKPSYFYPLPFIVKNDFASTEPLETSYIYIYIYIHVRNYVEQDFYYRIDDLKRGG